MPIHQRNSTCQFYISPKRYQLDNQLALSVPIYDIRKVKSSNGQVQTRYVIQTTLLLAGTQQRIEVTLTDRRTMQYPILLGREGMGEHFLVDPSQSNRQSHSISIFHFMSVNPVRIFTPINPCFQLT
ncbi:ATP-dependent zinc protease family protein [Shewanella surugensis]|uniref:RimK/LysX family protein n=1 Tax=Shewanella surugensis TaxID=212020 RepID=A0ABT0LE87_9GAMM|nr:RimK/LysX family protein [Shewanella surugensis]MCL1125998.1 RimK/LysX family protein [Shewanella surugensis]